MSGMERPSFDLRSFLAEPGRPASVATVTVSGQPARVRRIYNRYVPEWTPDWEQQAISGDYCLWSMTPERGMAVAYPGLADGPAFHWSGSAAFRALGS